MLDISNILTNSDYVSIFYDTGAVGLGGNSVTKTWTKPRNCKFVYMIAIGAGGGGNGGTTSTQGTPGCAGSITRALYPASIIPDTLFVQVGRGGAGGAVGGSGAIGGPTRIYARGGNTLVTTNLLINATGGQNGFNASAWTTTGAGVLALLTSTGSPNPVAVTPGTNVTYSTAGVSAGVAGMCLCQGTEGGRQVGPTSAMGIQAPLGDLIIPGGIASTVGNGGDGNDGIFSLAPFYATGGTGGGGSSVAAGGNGGNGAYGCGGGGGAAGATAGGRGGRGGDGLAIIIAI